MALAAACPQAVEISERLANQTGTFVWEMSPPVPPSGLHSLRGQWEPGPCGVLPGGQEHFAFAGFLDNMYSLRNEGSRDAVN